MAIMAILVLRFWRGFQAPSASPNHDCCQGLSEPGTLGEVALDLLSFDRSRRDLQIVGQRRGDGHDQKRGRAHGEVGGCEREQCERGFAVQWDSVSRSACALLADRESGDAIIDAACIGK